MGGSNYGQELVNQQAPGSYKYGSGPSAYLSVAPGTKTLASKSFDEEKRARSVAEDLGERKFQEDLRAQKVAEALRASGGGGSGGGGLTAWQQYQIMRDMQGNTEKTRQWILQTAAERAKSDSRLAGKKVEMPSPDPYIDGTTTITTQANGKDYFTSEQLIDAHLRNLIHQYGLDLADFGLQPLPSNSSDQSPQFWGDFRDIEEKSRNQAQGW